MKKMLRILCVVLSVAGVLSSFASCKGDPPVPVTEKPLKEGYYTGEDFAIKLDYVGSNVECSYNLSLFNAETGLCYYKATALGVPENADKIFFIENQGIGDGVSVTVKDDVLTASGIGFMDGEYQFFGLNWESDYDTIKNLVSPGKYTKPGYVLNITEEDGKMIFSIQGDMSKELYRAETNSIVRDSLTLTEKDLNVSFTASGDENGTYIDVSDPVNGSYEAYFGAYRRENYDFLSVGDYFNGNYKITIKRSRDKSELSSYKTKIELIVTDSGTIRLDESVSLDSKERPRCLEFFDGKIKVFKGYGKNGEYIDVISNGLSIASGRYYVKK